MVQLDIFQDETTKKYFDTFESCMINISEGASDEKSIAISWLNKFKEKIAKGEIKIVENK